MNLPIRIAKGSSMTARLHRILAILRDGNVPSAISHRPGVGAVLHAGTPEQGPWDVLLRDTGHRLELHHAGGTDLLADDAADSLIVDAVRIRVVQAWADRGDPEAKALIAMLQGPTQQPSAGYREQAAWPRQHVAHQPTMTVIDPLLIAADMFQAAHRMGWAMLTGRPVSAGFAWSGPWGAFLGVHIER